jgi:hypothetical protein
VPTREKGEMGFAPIFVLFVGLATLALGIAFRVGKLGRDKPWYRKVPRPVVAADLSKRYVRGSAVIDRRHPYRLGTAGLARLSSTGIGALIVGLCIVFGSFTVALFSPGWLKPGSLRADDEKWGGARLHLAFSRNKERIGNS